MSDGFHLSIADWIVGYASPSGAVALKCLRCGATCADPAPGTEPSDERIKQARIRLQNFANEHGDCLGETR